MFYYAIPLRAKETSRNWGLVCRLLQETVNACCARGGGGYRIVVACHDVPEWACDNGDENVSFVVAAHPVPVDKSGYMADKSAKKDIARRTILKMAKPGDFFMFLDADDLVSKEPLKTPYLSQSPHIDCRSP